jgi:hypothetical protein
MKKTNFDMDGDNLEKIQDHEIKDIYRIRDGLLVEVSKYNNLGYRLGSGFKAKGVRGCKGLKVLIEDFEDKYYKKIFKKGTYIYYDSPVEVLTDVNSYKYEIKSSGGSIYGSELELDKVLENINKIFKLYK